MDLAEGKQRLSIPALWARLSLSGECKKNPCHSPFYERTSKPSFSITADGRLFNDFRTRDAGDAVDFLRRATGLSREAACRKFIELAGGGVHESKRPATRQMSAGHPRAAIPRTREKPTLPPFQHGTVADFVRLAQLRNLSVEGLQLASTRGLLWFGNRLGVDAWIVSDGARVNAQARRMDGGTWGHFDGNPKAWTLGGSWAGWPIGAEEAKSFPKLALVEGGPDLLAAFHFIHCEGRERDVAPVAMLGASQRIHEDALPLFAGKRVRLFPHLDSAGQDAAARWTRQLELVGATVDGFDFTGLHRADGAPIGDLNDLASICADDFETEREAWAVMP